MSAAAYVVTKHVRHLGAWTQDARQGDSLWTQGRYRPICGARVSPPSDVMWVGFPYENQRKVDFALSRPVCRRCAKTLAALTEAAQS